MTNDYKQYSLESEQSVIGGLLIDNYKLPDVIEIITADDFYVEKHKIIFRAIELLYEKGMPVDPVMIITELTNNQAIESVGGLGYIAELAQNTPTATNVTSYAKRVRDKRKERDVLSMASQMASIICDEDGSSEDRINSALSVVSSFDSEEDAEQTYEHQQKEFIRNLSERIDSGGGITGLSTGFRDIDEQLNGLQKSDLIIVAGRPGSGKTTYALNIAKEVSKHKHTIIFSMEMSSVQIVEKIYSSFGVLMKSLKTGVLTDNCYSELNLAGPRVKSLKLTIDDRPALKPQQVLSKCLKIKRKYGEIGLIVIDYIQLMTTNKSDNRTDSVTQITNSLKALAKTIDCPVIALSQLNRSVEQRGNKRPMMSDLRESGSIEQDADIIQFIYRDDYYAEQEMRTSSNPFIAEINTSKFRGGETGVRYLRTELHKSRFVDVDQNYIHSEESTEKKPAKF